SARRTSQMWACSDCRRCGAISNTSASEHLRGARRISHHARVQGDRDMMTEALDAEPILRERIERYARARHISLADAIERLVRIGLMVEAVPIGSTLFRRGALPEWRTPEAEREPWHRGGPAPGEPDGDDPLF